MVLLDTHVVLWVTLSPEELSKAAAQIIVDVRNTILVSAVSAWEIATKVRLRKLPEAAEFEKEFFHVMMIAGYKLRSVSPTDALRAGRLPGKHRDPFDRMIAAQALADDIPIISTDAKLDSFGVRRLW
jgi:PIN domain nuclease of toxin-antitoxin system